MQNAKDNIILNDAKSLSSVYYIEVKAMGVIQNSRIQSFLIRNEAVGLTSLHIF